MLGRFRWSTGSASSGFSRIATSSSGSSQRDATHGQLPPARPPRLISVPSRRKSSSIGRSSSWQSGAFVDYRSVEGEKFVGIVAQADIAREGDDRATGKVVELISESEKNGIEGGLVARRPLNRVGAALSPWEKKLAA
jgi:hypothetical protein